MITVDKITQEALSLPKNLRIQLVDKLLASIEVDVNENTQKVWLTEARRRRDEIKKGIAESLSCY
ncbi:MAG: addiction module protein [Hormoscilla sp.]